MKIGCCKFFIVLPSLISYFGVAFDVSNVSQLQMLFAFFANFKTTND